MRKKSIEGFEARCDLSDSLVALKVFAFMHMSSQNRPAVLRGMLYSAFCNSGRASNRSATRP
ncbi:hypothetical protein CO648_29550 [Rhizobium phaseoli]|nr:hypothetical protein CO648_29550 [Rhizobium phaseoli]